MYPKRVNFQIFKKTIKFFQLSKYPRITLISLISLIYFNSFSPTSHASVMQTIGFSDINKSYQGNNKCESVSLEDRYQEAISTVAELFNMTQSELCQSDRWLGIEAQPFRMITREGEVIPHVRVYLHSHSSSCYFMVKDSDASISETRCFSAE